MIFGCVILFTILTRANTEEVGLLSNILDSANTAIKVIEADLMLMEEKIELLREKVKLQLYYECLCPDCRKFDTSSFLRVYAYLNDYLDVQTYPYGNAQTVVNDDGTVKFTCQHGPEECYGNMLHACAIDIINNTTKSILFNSCIMDYSNEGHGSDDRAADKCGDILKINAGPIKECAKSKKGVDLLKYYGDESHKVDYNYVPYVLINGAEWNQDKNPDFMKIVCEAFFEAPPPCAKIYDLIFN